MVFTVSWSSWEGLMGPFLGREPIFSTATLNWASALSSWNALVSADEIAMKGGWKYSRHYVCRYCDEG